MIEVPYISNSRLEQEAGHLLKAFALRRRIKLHVPIPIEDIIEKHLKIPLDIGDVYGYLGLTRPDGEIDVFGCTDFDSGLIFIDQSLDPETNPSMAGRYRFTLAHEVGHCCLHRPLFAKGAGQRSLLPDINETRVICRSSESNARLELQANYFAACLLMPRELVLETWAMVYLDRKPRILQSGPDIPTAYVPIVRTMSRRAAGLETDSEAFQRVAKPVADKLQVSAEAMAIRLEECGLLLRTVPDQTVLL